ncbi:MAG: PhoPQ-activated protein PqaA family protein [Planctomycetota bacterium]
MKAPSILFAFVLCSPLVSGLDEAGSRLPPASVFDMREMLNAETLELEITSDTVVTAQRSSGRRVRQIEFRFLSQVWGGEQVRHDAAVYIPTEGIAAEKRGLACISQGGSSNLGTGFSITKGYGQDVALRLGIPGMMITSNMPGDHFGITGQGPIRRYTTQRFFETGDLNWIHWIALAKAYMRGMTALNQIDGIDAERFVLSGSSKRAQSIWIVAAADSRVAGIVTFARPGNFTHLAQRYCQGRLATPSNLPIPSRGGRERMAYVEDLYTRRGYEYMAYIDPYYFLSRVNVPVMYIIGTNDRLFDNFDDHGFYPFYQGDKSFAYVPNYGHGMGTQTHADILHAWIARCFWGRPVTRLTALAKVQDNHLQVEAIVHPGVTEGTPAEIRKVNLHYCISKAKRFNDAKDQYVAHALIRMPATNLWRATVDIPENAPGPVFWYVEAIDRAQGLEGRATTLLEKVPAK